MTMVHGATVFDNTTSRFYVQISNVAIQRVLDGLMMVSVLGTFLLPETPLARAFTSANHSTYVNFACMSSTLGFTSISDILTLSLKGFISRPTNPNMPVMCIGPGTGIVRMRTVMEKRIHERYSNTTLQYFGCHSAHNQRYHSEWESYAEE
ncbi:uncharacterized protein EDB91DRAFT_686548 [Suillus paluster]|uniref:uncharacterized protein n=1 Tax=Suillus paluster TaxID=48578 RepID=UPI001B862E77|nr:uncharacterized protein EDB91DRAFT_686548 [Suillus paluster]KAG1750382.1 hypothetical protein EDB91DRAFT_686548 [Suillus paluster]